MPFNLILNSSNVIGTSNSQFRYNFIKGSFTISEDSEMCVSQVVIPYSWNNISSSYYSNATIQYIFPYAATTKTYTVVLPDGFYSTADINNFLQGYMILQNQYLIETSTGNNVYYIQLISNPTYYSNQILTFSVPTSLPVGYTAPLSGFNYITGGTNYGFPTIANTPQLIIPVYPSIGSILGFKAGIYPPVQQSSNYSIASYQQGIIPNATPVNSIIIMCDKVNNPCSMPSIILDSFSINSTFGSNITYTPAYEKWIDILEGTYNSLTITLTDQNFNTLRAQDPNVLISLSLRNGKRRKDIPKLPIYPKVYTIKHPIDLEEDK